MGSLLISVVGEAKNPLLHISLSLIWKEDKETKRFNIL